MENRKSISMKRRMVSLLTVLVMVCSLFAAVPAAEARAISQTDVSCKLNSLMSQYVGQRGSWNFAGGSQCYGFAHMIFNNIFGRGSRQVGNGALSSNPTNYRLNNLASDIRTIGSLGPGYSAGSLENLLEQAAPGDYVQVRRKSGTPHSMICVSVNAGANTIEIFDANSDGAGTAKHYTQSFSTFMSKNSGVSVYRHSSYSPGSSAAPTNPTIRTSQYWFDLQDTIEVIAHADGATSYFMSFYKDNQLLYQQGVSEGTFSLPASRHGTGKYSAYFSCSNSAGSVDTKWIDFSVVGAPSYNGVHVSKSQYSLNDTVELWVDSVCAKYSVIGIDNDTTNKRVITEKTSNDRFKIAASKLGYGRYSAYFSVANGSGSVDTKRVYFEIAEPASAKPKNPTITKSQEWYDLKDTIKVTAHANGASSYYMSMFKDDKRIYGQEVSGGTFTLSPSKHGTGKYSAYFSCSNSAGSVDTEWVTFYVVGAPSYKAVSASKSSYNLDETIELSVDASYTKSTALSIANASTGVKVLSKTTSGGKTTIPAKDLGAGRYQAYFTLSNGAGSTDTEKVSFEVKAQQAGGDESDNPPTVKKVTGVSVKPGKWWMTVRWNKVADASGYQITYAQNKSFTQKIKTVRAGKTPKKTILLLKSKKTYYVKVRAYKQVDGRKYYGSYSAVKQIKTK